MVLGEGQDAQTRGTAYSAPGPCALGWLVELHQAMGRKAVAY